MAVGRLLIPELGLERASYIITRGLGTQYDDPDMSGAFKLIRREMLMRAPELGRIITPSAITTTTVVGTQIIEASVQKYVGYFLCRPDAVTAAAADRVRRITSQTAPSTLIHNQTNYTDITGGTEQVELLQFEPYLYDNAIDVALGRLRRLDCTNIPTRHNTNRYWIGDMEWIEQPAHIIMVTQSTNPILNRNRFFEKWNSYDTFGVLAPDYWTITGASATATRSTTGNRRGTSTVAITGTDCTLLQAVGLLENGVTGDSLRGRVITLVGVCTSSVASQMRLRATDGTQTVNSSYHTGGGTTEELTTTITVAAAATSLSYGFSIEGSDTTCYADEMYGYEVSSLDSARMDAWEEGEIQTGFDQGNGTLSLILPQAGRGSNFMVYSQRPYPRMDQTRLLAGTMDNDIVDAPVALVATGAIARLYEGLSAQPGQDGVRYLSLAREWEARSQNLAGQHLGMPGVERGIRFPTQRYAPAVR